MKISRLLVFTIGNVVSMTCTPVVAQDTSGINFAALLSNLDHLDFAAMIASGPSILVAIADIGGVILQAAPQIVNIVATNVFNPEVIIDEVSEIFDDVIVNMVAIVGATAANAFLAAGLLPTLNAHLSDNLERYDPMYVTRLFNTSKQHLTNITVDSCYPTSYTYNKAEVTATGHKNMTIKELAINDQSYEDNQWFGDISVTVGGFHSGLIFLGKVFEDKCGEMSNEEYTATYDILNFEGTANLKLIGTIEGQAFTLKNLTIVSASHTFGQDTSQDGPTYPIIVDSNILEYALEDEVQVYRDMLDDLDFANNEIQGLNFPFTFTLPFKWPF